MAAPKLNKITDDSHKYPLRKSGASGYASAAPPYLLNADTAAVNTTTGDGGDIGGGDDVEKDGDGRANGKLKGYEGHMSALGKLGAGSAEARLFPTPGKKLMKAVGQAIQVRRLCLIAYGDEAGRCCLQGTWGSFVTVCAGAWWEHV